MLQLKILIVFLHASQTILLTSNLLLQFTYELIPLLKSTQSLLMVLDRFLDLLKPQQLFVIDTIHLFSLLLLQLQDLLSQFFNTAAALRRPFLDPHGQLLHQGRHLAKSLLAVLQSFALLLFYEFEFVFRLLATVLHRFVLVFETLRKCIDLLFTDQLFLLF